MNDAEKLKRAGGGLGLGILALWLLAGCGVHGLGSQHSIMTAAQAASNEKNIKPSQPEPAKGSVLASQSVMSVNHKFDFVVVNIGLRDGIKIGDHLKVFRGGKDIATIQMEKLYNKFSTAVIIEENPEQQIAAGDEILKV